MEMAAAMLVAGLMVGVFYTSLHRIRRLETLALTQGRALTVLENVVERLAAEPGVTAALAAQVLEEEFASSDLNLPERFSIQCRPQNDGIQLLVVRADGRAVATVEVGP